MGSPPRNTGLIIALRSIGGASIGMLVIALVLGFRMHQWEQQDTKATSVAAGTVVERIKDRKDHHTVNFVKVRWVDQQGHAHLTKVDPKDPQMWVIGLPYSLRYDPADPGGFTYPLYGEEYLVNSDELNYQVPLGFAVFGYSVIMMGWFLRFFYGWRAAHSRETEFEVMPLLGRSNNATCAYLLMAAPGHRPFGDQLLRQKMLPKDVAIQRVMWNPAIDKLETGTTVTARVKRGLGHRAVVILPNGTRIWPAGRLRRRLPRTWLLARRGLSPQSPRLWPNPFLTPAAALVGLLTGFFIAGGLIGAIALGAAFMTIPIHAWGWYSGDPT